MHRNKYIEGARKVREKPFITLRSIGALVLASAIGYAAFWYYVSDINDGATKSSGMADQVLMSVALIVLVVVAGTAVGAVIGWLRSRARVPSLLDKLQAEEAAYKDKTDNIVS